MDPEQSAPDANDTMLSALDAPIDEAPAAEPDPTPAPAPEPGVQPSTPAAAAPASASPPEPAAVPLERIPLATLLDERRRSEERYQALLARTEALEKGAKAADAPPTPPAPDWLEDPKGYIDAVEKRALEALKKVQEGTEERTSKAAAAAADANLNLALTAAQDAFTATTPDFKDALGYARNFRGQQLEVLNPGMPPAQIAQIIHTEERNLAATLARQGINPAERIYQLSKAMGYTPKAAVPPPASPPPVNGAGARVVDPGVTLNSTPGTTASEVDDDEVDMLAQAKSERFGRTRSN
jgi:hypothetical protein